jgi:hypothetical protein
MAQSVIGSLRVNLGLDSAQFQRGAKRMDKPLARMQKQFLGIATVAAAMGTAIAAAALMGAKEIDRAAKSAKRLDSSITGFRALELAADEAGVSLSGMTNDIQTMNRELASIGTSGNGKRALDALGLSIDDLEGKDADEKLAIIADQVKDLGLSAGETTAILRDLGVRNREMALLVLGGGDAIRGARADIEQYGLAISDLDAGRIEVANDALGRLGLITQYAGQQLSIALVPAMGRLAEVMTDSLREGGALRAVIDGLVGSLGDLTAALGVLVVSFAATKIPILVTSIVGLSTGVTAASFAVGVLTKAMAGLRIAIAFLGGPLGIALGLLAAGATSWVLWGNKALIGRSAAEEARIAIALLNETLDSFSQVESPAAQGAALGNAMAYKAQAKAALEVAKAELLKSSAMLEAMGATPDENTGVARRAGQTKAAQDSYKDSKALIDSLGTSLTNADKRIKDIAITISNQQVPAIVKATKVTNDLTKAITGGSAAPKALDTLKTKADALKESMSTVKSGFKSAFDGIVTRSKSVKQAIGGILKGFADMLMNRAFQTLWSGGSSGGGGLGGFIGNVLGFANGTNNAPGGMALVGERGPELVNLPRGSQVRTATDTQRMLGGGQSGPPVYNIIVNGARGNMEIRDMVSQGIKQASGGLTAQAVSQSQASFRNSKAGWSP